MKSKMYQLHVRPRLGTRALMRALCILMPNFASKLSAEMLTTLGRGTFLVNLFCRILGVNREAPFLVHFTTRLVLADGISIEEHADSSSVYACFAASSGCYFMGLNGIVIARGVYFAPGVKVISANHAAADLTRHVDAPPIKIGCYSWLGANVVVLPGVSIGERCIIGAGAVVTKDVPAGEMWGGVPAKFIGKTGEQEQKLRQEASNYQ